MLPCVGDKEELVVESAETLVEVDVRIPAKADRRSDDRVFPDNEPPGPAIDLPQRPAVVLVLALAVTKGVTRKLQRRIRELRAHPLDLARQEQVIRVQKTDDVSLRRGNAGIAGGGGAPVDGTGEQLRLQARVSNNCRQAGLDVGAAAVVDDDHIDSVALADERAKRPLQPVGIIEVGDDDGNPLRGHCSRIVQKSDQQQASTHAATCEVKHAPGLWRLTAVSKRANPHAMPAALSPPAAWLVAGLLFAAGANVLSLIFPFGALLALAAVVAFARRPLACTGAQALVLAIGVGSALCGVVRAAEMADITANLRQLIVVTTAFLLVGTLRSDLDTIVDRFFHIFVVASGIGLVAYLVAANFQPLTTNVGERTYLIGPSSRIFDFGVGAPSLFGDYRFQGLMDEPGTFGVFAAAALFWALKSRRYLQALMVGGALVLSESIGGFLSLAVLLGWDWLVRQKLLAKIVTLAVVCLIGLGVWQSPVGRMIEEGWELFVELRTLSGQTRGDQLGLIFSQWRDLLLPGGFSDTAIIRIVPQSVTVGFGRSVIILGIPLFAIAMLLLVVALRRSSLVRPTGLLLASLALAGLSRSGVFDLLLGWFALLACLACRAPARAPHATVDGSRPLPRLQINSACP